MTMFRRFRFRPKAKMTEAQQFAILQAIMEDIRQGVLRTYYSASGEKSA